MKHNFKYPILACGAESKGAFSIAKGRDLFVSRDFGSLGDYNNLSKYEKNIKKDLKRFDIKPAIIACDMHPDYNSTTFAEELKIKDSRLIKVQHHHAHIASCMQDNNLKGEVIGIAFDGTGYGTDNGMWGGEFLISSLKDFKRAAHLKYLPMPGGDKAIMEPWRMAAVYLWDSFGDNFLNLGTPFTKKIKLKDWHLLRYIVARSINSPLTSSIGRLFDAVASMLILILKVNFEAEAAIRLQEFAERAGNEKGGYRYNIVKEKEGHIIDLKEMIREIARDIKAGVKDTVIAAKFHNSIAWLISDICVRLRRLNKINRVVLSGGVFQNRLLTERAIKMLRELDFDVYAHKRFSPSDAGISVGQAVVAGARCKRCV